MSDIGRRRAREPWRFVTCYPPSGGAQSFDRGNRILRSETGFVAVRCYDSVEGGSYMRCQSL
jgi:hypothetical protein